MLAKNDDLHHSGWTIYHLIVCILVIGFAVISAPGQMNPTQSNYGTQDLSYLSWINGSVYLLNDSILLPGQGADWYPGTPPGSIDVIIVGLDQNPAPGSLTLLAGPTIPIWVDPLGSVFTAAPNWITPVFSPGLVGHHGKVWSFPWIGGPIVGGTFGLTVHMQMLRVTGRRLAGYSNMLSLTL